ncbi:MAG: sigma-70 family RNA polymerase sigma factor [Gammaproteobacteria bacterium]|nr:sigma-70 family RNA polymerase sigma factor [Gammaproteobacteria bacterium]
MTSHQNLLADESTLLDLLAKTALRDRAAFKRLYDSTAPRLFAVARNVLHEPTLAEDALQDAFVQVWHRATDYHAERGTVMTWLTTIVRYRAIDVSRRQRRDTSSFGDSETADPSTEPDLLAESLEHATELRDCLQRLSASQQHSITLAFFEGLTHEEVAQRVGTPMGTIKSRIRRGLSRLRECLES